MRGTPLPGDSLIEIGVGFFSDLVEIHRFVRSGFFGGDEEGGLSVDVEERRDGFWRRRARGLGNENFDLCGVRHEPEELHFLVTVRTFDGEVAEDPSQEGRPTGRERFFGNSLDLRLCFQAQESPSRGGIEAGIAAVVLVAVGDVDGEVSQEFHRGEGQRLSLARPQLNRRRGGAQLG